MHIFSIFQYQLVTFNDYGPDITQNVEVREPTEDLNRFKQEILGLEFESFDGGRDSKERLLQGLLVSIFRTRFEKYYAHTRAELSSLNLPLFVKL